MGGGKGGGQSTVTQSNPNPWSGAAPYLTQGLDALQQVFQHGTPGSGQVTIGGNTFDRGVDVPDYYPGSTITSLSPWTQQALAMQAQRGLQGSPLTDAAQGELTRTMGGYYLHPDSNPYLTETINAATAPVESAVNSAFSSAGRYGSGSHVDELGRSIGDISSRMASENYNNERGRMTSGMMFAPQLAQQDYFDINQVGATGSALDAYNQSLINSDIERYNYGQDADWQRVQQFLGAINGAAPFGSTGTSRGPAPDMFQSMLGGGLGLAGIGSMLGLFGGGGAGLGAAGSMAGLMLSDERVKTDIERIGELDNGLTLYNWHYIGESPDAPKHAGVMAQEALEVKPEAVGMLGPFLAVDYQKVMEPTDG
jgi:endosialidase-like protein